MSYYQFIWVHSNSHNTNAVYNDDIIAGVWFSWKMYMNMLNSPFRSKGFHILGRHPDELLASSPTVYTKISCYVDMYHVL